MILKRLAAAVTLVLAAGVTEAQTKLTFVGALSRALEVNNTVERARQDVDVALAQKRYLFSAVLPRIAATGDLTRNSIQQSFGEGDDAFTILPRNDWAYRVVLSQPLFAGRRELRAYSQAKIGVEIAREAELGAEDAVLLRVASSYLGVLSADRSVEVENQNIALAEKRLAQAKSFYEAGEVTRVDVLRAETAIKASQRLLSAARQQREHAVAQLRADLDLEGEIEVAPLEGTRPELPPEVELVARATADRPDVEVAEKELRAAALEISKQRGFALPTVTFDGGWINQKTAFPADRYSYGAIRFNVPIFQSGEVAARVAGAKARQKQAELALEEARVAAREDVRKALADLESAHTGIQLAREQLQAAEAEYQQSFDLYRAQEMSSLDLASSEASLAEARRALSDETRNHDLAELRVWYAAGALKDAVGLESTASEGGS